MFSFTCKDAKSCVNSSVYKKLNKDKKKYEQLNDELILNILKDRDFYFENFYSGAMSDHIIHYQF